MCLSDGQSFFYKKCWYCFLRIKCVLCNKMVGKIIAVRIVQCRSDQQFHRYGIFNEGFDDGGGNDRLALGLRDLRARNNHERRKRNGTKKNHTSTCAAMQ